MLFDPTHHQLVAEFHNEKFIVHKSNCEFSALANGQSHEQAHVVIKGDCGAIDVPLG